MSRPWRTIVAPEDLHAHVDDPSVRVLDCRHDLADPDWGEAAYRKGHVPGALHAHLDRDLSGPVTPRTGRHPLPDPFDFRAAASRWGIRDDTQVVAYDDRGGQFAARLWWLLRDYGHFDVAVLDGGIQAWTSAGFPIHEGETPPPEPARFDGRPGHMRTLAGWDLTTRAARRLLDARAPERYRGDVEPLDPEAGHIPGALNAPSATNLGPDGRMLPADKLREKYAPLVGDLDGKDVAVYCGSGVTATHDVLALEIAGWPGAAIYPGSWSEWSRDPERPVAKGDAERETVERRGRPRGRRVASASGSDS